MSTRHRQARTRARLGRHRTVGHVGRPLLLVGAVLTTVLVAATSASAYWGSAGSGTATATTGTLAPPTGVSVSDTPFVDVPVSWTTSVGQPVPDGYYVTRTDGETTVAACATSPASLVLGDSCTDADVPIGDHAYVVTAVFRSWTAPSTASGTVTVSGATRLLFGIQPTDTVSGAVVTPAVSVFLATPDGTAVAAGGVPITIAIGANPAAGILAGPAVIATEPSGSATFDALSVAQVGDDYTLSASADGLTAATSDPFDIEAPGLLGTAAAYSVLAGTAVVSTGATSVSGDLGVSPGTSVVGFPPGTVGGVIHAGDTDAANARSDLADAYTELAARAPDDVVSGDLGGTTLPAGVYSSGAALAVTGTLTLDADGDADAVFVFQVGAALNTAAASAVDLVDGAQASNVYWVVAAAAGTGANSFFAGTILAQGAITLGAGTQLIGRALSVDAVTLAASTIRFTTALPPTITLDGGAAAATKDTTPEIGGASDAPAGSAVAVTVAGQTLLTTIGGDGTWTVTAAALGAGPHTVVAKVRDAAGNGATAAQELTVEINPPLVVLGTAATYSVLAATGVVSTGASDLAGDLGLSPGVAVTGFPPGVVHGAVHVNDPAAATAQADLLAAIGDASTRTPHTQIVGDIGGRTFHIGVHHITAALSLTGTVTLDAEGDPDAVFIFQTDAALNTAAASAVDLVNGAQASHVFWVVTGAAGTGADSAFAGAILARGAITLGAGTDLVGQALSRDTVTLAGTSVTSPTGAP